jgi:protoporphyrin/coproporphyrin ferrochelatase
VTESGVGDPEGIVGVLLMAYGTPATPDDIEAYYTHVRRGRPPTPELLAELRGRYEAIGGTSPLLERTEEQRAGIEAALGDGYRVQLGMKHAPPFLEDGVASLAAAGVSRIVGLVLAPHYSALSVGEYAGRAAAAAAEAGVPLTMVESWHLAPGYLDLLARFVTDTVAGLGVEPVEVVFTAHSLPERILAMGDPYPDQLAETAAAVAERTGVRRWSVGWQSAGRTPEPWIGPDLLDVLPMLVAAGAAGAVVCPAGFVSDHLEILYDLDVEARAAAERLGLPFARTPAPNAHPAFCATVAEVVRAA